MYYNSYLTPEPRQAPMLTDRCRNVFNLTFRRRNISLEEIMQREMLWKTKYRFCEVKNACLPMCGQAMTLFLGIAMDEWLYPTPSTSRFHIAICTYNVHQNTLLSKSPRVREWNPYNGACSRGRGRVLWVGWKLRHASKHLRNLVDF